MKSINIPTTDPMHTINNIVKTITSPTLPKSKPISFFFPFFCFSSYDWDLASQSHPVLSLNFFFAYPGGLPFELSVGLPSSS